MLLLRAGTGLAVGSAVLALLNRRTVTHLDGAAPAVSDAITVCIPARNEEAALPALLDDLRAQRGVPNLRVIVLDDDSDDATFAAATTAICNDSRFELHRRKSPPPAGAIGKPAACQALSELADISNGVLVFLDADVRLEPHALAAAVGELRNGAADLIAPWPEQLSISLAERMVQPLLCWSWASTLPVTVANRSRRPSTAVACGQFLVFDAEAYHRIGGHSSVLSSVTEDLDIARVLRRAGGHTAVVGAAGTARCRMYSGAADLAAGYERWLWSAYGGSAGSIAVGSVLSLMYLLPPAAAVFGRGRTRAWGLVGYGAAVTSRFAARSIETSTDRRTPDALLHPASVAMYLGLTYRSHRGHRRGTLAWKGRALP